MIITRIAIDLHRAIKRSPERPEQDLTEFVIGEAAGPEVELFKAKYAQEFREALISAIAQLCPEDRNALRAHYVHRLTVDQMAPAFGIHRATAARRVARARAVLVTATRNALRLRLDVSTDTLDSLLGFIQSGLDLSISRLLDSTGRLDPG